MKGIGILLVCLGHATSSLSHPLNTVILSFHMPLFFFVSGILFGFDSTKSFGKFFGRKAHVLLLPQIVLAVVTILVDVFMNIVIKRLIFHSDSAPIDFVSPFLNWFLIVLFLAELVLWAIDNLFSHKEYYKFVILPVLIIAFAFCNYKGLYVQQTMVALIFLLLGWLFKPILNWYIERFKYKGIFALLIPVVVILSMLNLPIGMYINQYGNKALFLITAVVGILAVFDLSFLLQYSKLLLFFGKNSIIIYVTHFALQKLLRMVCGMFDIEVSAENLLGIMLLFIATVVIEIFIVWFINKYLYFLFGKKKQIKNKS